MRIPSSNGPERLRWRAAGPAACALAMVALSLSLAACSQAGDFGRPERLLLFGGPAANWAGDPVGNAAGSSLGLTADEVTMRDTAYRLRVNIHNLMPLGDQVAASDYADHLTRSGFLFGPSRLARIDHELQSDHETLTDFGHAARRVAFADRERRRALDQVRLHASQFDRTQARNRIHENWNFLEGTFADIDRRIENYRRAIDRTRIETPAVSTVTVDFSLNHFRDRVASLRYEIAEIYRDEPPVARPARPAVDLASASDRPMAIVPPGNANGRRHPGSYK